MQIQFPTSAGIYQIRNFVNSKVYVGSAVNFRRRQVGHLTKLRNNQHRNIHLQRAWNKYGKNNFIFEIIERVKDKNNLIKREQYWINKTNCINDKYGYNISPKAGSSLGIKRRKETLKKNVRSFKRKYK